MPSANEDLLDRATRHSVYLERYKAGLVRRLLGILSQVDQDLTAKLIGRDPEEWSTQRLETMLREIRGSISDATAKLRDGLEADLRDLSEYEADFALRSIEEAAPVALDLTRPAPATLRSVIFSQPFQGKHLREWFEELEEAQFRRVRDAIRIGVVEGETVDQMVRRLRGTRANNYSDGILAMNRRNAEAVVRTAVNHTTTAAREQSYKSADVVKAVKWVSTLDGRTSPICMARDGQVYDVDKGPRPPAHPNCRSSTAPILKSWREMGIDIDDAPPGTRASLNGQVPADTTYGEWLKRQDRGFVEEVLGQRKAKLFLDGNLSIGRFVNRAGNELTLSELRRRESSAFERAGLAD